MTKEKFPDSKWINKFVVNESVNEEPVSKKWEFAVNSKSVLPERHLRHKLNSKEVKLLKESAETQSLAPQTKNPGLPEKPVPALIRIKNIQRRSLYNPGENNANSSRQKRIFLYAVGCLCATFVALAVLFTVSPDFRYALMETNDMKALANAKKEKNWLDSKRQMNAIVERASRAKKLASVQVWLMTEYGGALMTHQEYPEAMETFAKCAKLSAQSPDWYTYSVMMKGLCEHQMCLANPRFKPNTDEVKNAEKISEGLQEKYRTGSLMAILGNLYGDVGDWQNAIRYFDDADKTFRDMGGGMDWKRREVLDDRWFNQMRMLVFAVKQLPKPQPTTVSLTHVDALTTKAWKLLDYKEFGKLDQLFEEAAKSRVQTRSGREVLDDMFFNTYADGNLSFLDYYFDKIQLYAAHSPRSVSPYMLLANFYNSVATHEKDTNYLVGAEAERDETRVQLNLAKKQLSMGAEQLQKALSLGTPRPQWFSLAQINILRVGSKNSERVYDALTDTAKSFYPDYMPIYLNKIEFLQNAHPEKYEEWLTALSKEADSLGGANGDKLYALGVEKFIEKHLELANDVPFSKKRTERGEALLNKQFQKNGI